MLPDQAPDPESHPKSSDDFKIAEQHWQGRAKTRFETCAHISLKEQPTGPGGTYPDPWDNACPIPADGDYASMNACAPPCIAAPPCFPCRYCCEYSCLCRCCGSCGFQSLDPPHRRKRVMGVAWTFSMIALGISIVAAMALSDDPDVLYHCCWSRAIVNNIILKNNVSLDKLVVSVGLNGVAFHAWRTGEDTPRVNYTAWSDADCGSRYCESCRSTALASVTGAVMGCITMIPTMQTNCQRCFRFYDLNCQKGWAIGFSGLFGGASTLMALSAFAGACFRDIPDSFKAGQANPLVREVNGSVSYGPGPGLFCIVAATLMKVIDIFFHAILPTPESLWPARSDRNPSEFVEISGETKEPPLSESLHANPSAKIKLGSGKEGGYGATE